CFSLNDTRNTNLIFVGSPSENLSLLTFRPPGNLFFREFRQGRAKAILLVSKHPKPGEVATCLASLSASPVTEDYAVVVLVQRATPSRMGMILAGTTTFG